MGDLTVHRERASQFI